MNRDKRKRNLTRYVILLLLFVTIINAQQSEDVLYLKNGSKIIGTIIERTPGQNIKIRTRDWNVFAYEVDEIDRIEKEIPEPKETHNQYSTPSQYKQGESYGQERPPIVMGNYTVIGGALGTPGGLNFIYGQMLDEFGFRISAGYAVNWAGIQIDGCKRLPPTPDFEHDIYIALGISEFSEESYQYIGVGYDIYYQGIFGSLNLEIGGGDRSNPQIGFQIGYLHRIN